MRRQTLLLLGALALGTLGASHALAAPTLTLTAPASAEYGRPLTLHIIGRDLDLSLRDYRPTALSNLFHIDSIDFVRDESRNEQTLAVRVYPREPGTVQVPPLVFQDLSTQPSSMNVTEARDRKTGQPITVDFRAAPDTVWLRQAISVGATVTMPDPVAVLNAPVPSETTWHIEPVPTETSRANKQAFAHRTGWHIFALQPGKQTLQLPAVELVRDGVITHRFFPRPLAVQVKPLPPYLPATVPVGTARVDVAVPQQWWLREDTLQSLVLTVSGTGVLPKMLPPVATQLHSNASVVFYPATVDYRKHVTADVLDSSAEIVVPFRTLTSGRIELPDLRLQWFDPASSQLRSTMKPLRLPISLSLPWLASIVVTAVLAASVALYWLGMWLHNARRRLRKFRRALGTLESAKTPHDLREALKQVADAEGWQHNATLRTWYENWTSRYGPQPELGTSVEQLQRLLYAARSAPVTKLKYETIRHSIRLAHPLIARLALNPPQ